MTDRGPPPSAQSDLEACTAGCADGSTSCRTVASAEWWLLSQQCNRRRRSAPSLAASRPAAGGAVGLRRWPSRALQVNVHPLFDEELRTTRARRAAAPGYCLWPLYDNSYCTVVPDQALGEKVDVPPYRNAVAILRRSNCGAKIYKVDVYVP